jgi:RimJ/RimL family protein N-acetyltransferase
MPGTIRRAEASDAAQIAEIIGGLIAEPNPVGFDRVWTADEISQWIARQGDQGAFFVIDDGGRVLGFATMDFNTAEPDAASFGAWIRRENRRAGFGTLLAEYCLAFARERRYRRIRARLPEDNEAALSFLSSIGALVPLFNPGTSFELPIYHDGEPS